MFKFAHRSTPPNPFTASKRTDYRQAFGRMLTVGLLILGLGCATVNHYGVSWDEGTEIAIVKYNVDWIRDARPIPRDLKYYGLVFNGSTELLFQAKQWLANPRTYRPGQELEGGDRAITEALAQRIQFKHWLTFLWTIAAYGGVMLTVALLTGVRNAWFAAVVLVLMPRFWGHSFFNPKDIPFAVLFTVATALGALLLGRYHQATAQLTAWTLGRRPRLWLWAGGYGIVLGLLSGVRIGGWVVLGFMGIAHLCSGGLRGLGSWRRLLGFYGPMVMMFALTTTAVYPSAWANPIAWFWETNRYLSQHPWASQVLFQGDYWQAVELPWFYLPVWVGLTVPVVWLVAAGWGVILLVLNYRVLTPRQRAAAVLVLLQGLGLPLAAIFTNASVYGGMRQFLFVLPSLAAIAAWGLIWSYQQLIGRWRRFVALSLLVVALSPVVFDMIRLHPYQYIYFNRLSGSLSAAYGQYDLDYWGVSLREGVTWLNDVAQDKATVAIGGPQYVGEISVRPDLDVLNLEEDLDYGVGGQPDYYVSMVYLELPTLFDHCPTVHQVQRQGVPLTIVKDCTEVEFVPGPMLEVE